MKMIENEMNVTVHLEIIKASEIEPKEVKIGRASCRERVYVLV